MCFKLPGANQNMASIPHLLSSHHSFNLIFISIIFCLNDSQIHFILLSGLIQRSHDSSKYFYTTLQLKVLILSHLSNIKVKYVKALKNFVFPFNLKLSVSPIKPLNWLNAKSDLITDVLVHLLRVKQSVSRYKFYWRFRKK